MELKLKDRTPNVQIGEFETDGDNPMRRTVRVWGKKRSDVISYKIASMIEKKAADIFRGRCSIELIDGYPAWKNDPSTPLDVSSEYGDKVVHPPIISRIRGEVVFVKPEELKISIRNEEGQEVAVDYPSPRSVPAVAEGDQVEPGTVLFEELRGLAPEDMIHVAVWRVTVL